MTREGSNDSTPKEEAFLFPVLPLEGPLEELEAAAEKRLRACASLGEKESAARLRKALDLARTRLEAVLSAPRLPAGS